MVASRSVLGDRLMRRCVLLSIGGATENILGAKSWFWGQRAPTMGVWGFAQIIGGPWPPYLLPYRAPCAWVSVYQLLLQTPQLPVALLHAGDSTDDCIIGACKTSHVSHSKSRPVPHCRVLPPGEFNGTISEPLAIYTVVQKNTPTLADYIYDPVQSILIIFSKLFVC